MNNELKLINKKKVLEVLRAYFLWKKSSKTVKKLNGRGINLPEAISERLVCYFNDFSLTPDEGSYDAINSKRETIQIKATSVFDNELTSFGPRSKFDFLHFARFDIDKDEVWLYDIPKKQLDSVVVNKKKNETFLKQQEQGRRPRLSIVKEFVEKLHLEPYKKVNLCKLHKSLNDEKV